MTPMALDDEQVLVARLSAGDTGAFDEVYGAYPATGVRVPAPDDSESRARRGSARRNVASAGPPRDQGAA